MGLFSKIKNWLFGKVIMTKVFGKFAKHTTGVIIAFLSGPQIAPWIEKFGISFDSTTMEAGLIAVLTGLFGAAFNFIEHRFIKK